MKRLLILLGVCLCAVLSMYAQKILKNSPFKSTFNAKNVKKAIAGLKDCYVVENDGVSFIEIIDNLPLGASSIYAYAAEYMTETYEITKYNVLQENKEKGFIIGEGEFNSFSSYAAYPNQYTFTCNPSLRIDAKDGRARVCVFIRSYSQIRTNGNIREDKEVDVTDVSPLNPNNEDSQKMYNKVFLAFAQKAKAVIQNFSDFIHTRQTEDIGDW